MIGLGYKRDTVVMIDLKILCFNGFELNINNTLITRFYSQKAKALLIYLAVEANQRHDRSFLAGLLWPDFSESRARRNLSQTLTALRKDILDENKDAPIILSTSKTIEFKNQSNFYIDVQILNSNINFIKNHQHSHPHQCAICQQYLIENANVYKGPFLNHFEGDISPEFENWILAKQEYFSQQAIEVLIQLSKIYEVQREFDKALSINQQLLELAPWLESAHRFRMILLAKKGQRIQALNQYSLLSDILMEELGVSPSEETNLIYDQIADGKIKAANGNAQNTTNFTVSQPKLNIPFQAPALTPYFVERKNHFNKIKELLDKTDTTLQPISLVGMGGAGKTTFAIQQAHALKDQFPDGVLWGNTYTSSLLNILEVWAKAYGYDFSELTDLESKATAVRNMMVNKKALVIIDNVDQAEDIRSLLPGHGKSVVIFTTRNKEVALALNANTIHLKEFTPGNSKSLLINILGSSRVNEHPSELESADQICRLLNHLPLAVELAAQKLKARPQMPLASLAVRLQDAQKRLSLKVSDQAIRSSIEVSWQDLADISKQYFIIIAIFQGRPFSTKAFSHIAGIDLFDAEDELYALSSLSLIYEQENNRYQQHLLIADFALEKLMSNESLHELTKTRFINWYFEYVKKDGKEYSRYNLEWDNIRSAIAYAFELKQFEKCIEFCLFLTPAWQAKGLYAESRNAYHYGLNATKALEDLQNKCQILFNLGSSWLEQNDYSNAKPHLEESLNIFYHLEDTQGIASSFLQLAKIEIEQNQLNDATDLLNKSEEIIQIESDQEILANIYLQQGVIAYVQNVQSKAEQLFNQSLNAYRMKGLEVGQIESLRLLAHVQLNKNNFSLAEDFIHQANNICEQINNKPQLASNLYTLTAVYLRQKKFHSAIETGLECIDILTRTGQKRTKGMVSREISDAYAKIEEYDNALQFGQKSETIFDELHDELGVAFAQRQIGDVYKATNQMDFALQFWQSSYAIAQKLSNQTLISSLDDRINNLNLEQE